MFKFHLGQSVIVKKRERRLTGTVCVIQKRRYQDELLGNDTYVHVWYVLRHDERCITEEVEEDGLEPASIN